MHLLARCSAALFHQGSKLWRSLLDCVMWFKVVMAARGELAVLMEGGLEAEEVPEAQ